MSNFNAKQYLRKEETTSPWLVLPMILAMIIVPLILGIYSFDPEISTEYWYTTSNSSTDLFLYYKSFYLTFFGAVMALILIGYRFMTHRKFSFGLAMIPVYVYMGCIILSTIFSESPTHSLHGIVHHFESTFVLLTYCLLVMYAAYFINNERNLKWLINGFLIGTIILVLFGTSQILSGVFKDLYDNQILSYDSGFYSFMNSLTGCTDGMHWYEKLEPFKTQWMADYLYLPTGQQSGKLSLNFPLGQVYLTLYNPNYVAFFTTLTAPLFATLAFFQDKLWKKIVFALVSIGSILCLAGSQSVAGFLSVGVSVIVLIVAFRKKIFGRKIVWISSTAGIVVLAILFNLISGGVITDKFNYVKDKLSSSLQSGFHNEEWFGLRDLTSTADGIRIEYYDHVAIFSMDYDNQKGITYQFKDEDGNVLETKSTTDSEGATTTVLMDERFSNKTQSQYKHAIRVTSSEVLAGASYLPHCTLHIDNKGWIVTNQLRERSYSYGINGQSSYPFTVMNSATDDKLGKYYYYTNLPMSSVTSFLQDIASDRVSLQNCFAQLATVTDEYTEIGEKILNSSDPSMTARSYFSQIASDNDELYYFLTFMTLSMERDENYYYYNQTGRWTQLIEKPESVIFDNYPRFASTRGFMWSRSIPIMFESPRNFLIGTGPDTFSHVYPHYDYVDLYRADFGGKIITKPHNLYLQIGVQTGMVSLIAVLALYIMYVVSCIRLYWKSSFTTLYSKVSIGILASITGYMVSGITNDSTVTYSFVYWILLGVGIAVNRLEKQARLDEQEQLEKEKRLEQQRLEREERRKQRKQAASN